MTAYLVIIMIILFFTVIKYLIDINTLALRISKNKELNQQENDLEDKYQFIKGLF